MVDHHVDRPGVEAQQCAKLTGPNRSIGLSLPPAAAASASTRHRQRRNAHPTTQKHHDQELQDRASPTWWSWRGRYTRSHPELGREIPQRRWYFVSRRGRVGRRQVGQARTLKTHAGRLMPVIRHRIPPLTRSHTAGWSSPVARQAHNLKVAGSNPAPATNILL